MALFKSIFEKPKNLFDKVALFDKPKNIFNENQGAFSAPNGVFGKGKPVKRKKGDPSTIEVTGRTREEVFEKAKAEISKRAGAKTGSIFARATSFEGNQKKALTRGITKTASKEIRQQLDSFEEFNRRNTDPDEEL